MSTDSIKDYFGISTGVTFVMFLVCFIGYSIGYNQQAEFHKSERENLYVKHKEDVEKQVDKALMTFQVDAVNNGYGEFKPFFNELKFYWKKNRNNFYKFDESLRGD